MENDFKAYEKHLKTLEIKSLEEEKAILERMLEEEFFKEAKRKIAMILSIQLISI